MAAISGANDETTITEVFITGSRINSRSFTQPTPTKTVTAEDLEKASQPISFETTSGAFGAIPVDSAGVNVGNTPDWKATFSQRWTRGKLSVARYERWISDGVYSNEFVECTSSCPTPTATTSPVARSVRAPPTVLSPPRGV